MTLENKLLDDLKEAMKRKDALTTSVLRMLKSQLMLEKTKKGGSRELSDETVQQVFAGYAKKLIDAVEQFEKGGRDDLVAGHKAELEVVRRYLPEAASQEEINQAIEEAIQDTGASGLSEMGKVMAQVMGKLKGRADGKTLSQLVRQRLAGE